MMSYNNELMGLIKEIYNLGFQRCKLNVSDIEGYEKEIKKMLQPGKVKLPKAAYEWMEERKGCCDNVFESELYTLPTTLGSMPPSLRNFYQMPGSMFFLVDAHRYGYELEETEEDRIKRSLRETIYKGLGAMATDELVNDLYDIVNPKLK